MSPRILLLDIETSPNVAHVWGLWQQNVGLPQLINSGYVMCWSAKWLGEKEIFFSSIHKKSPLKMLAEIHSLLDEADAVVHYNGTKFDIPTLNKEFILYGFPPPAPYKQIDLLTTTRRQFKFPSNKLDYVAQALGLGAKKKHKGHELWIQCMNNEEPAWRQMEAYNKQDVILLERLYKKLKAWIKAHINYNLFKEEIVCPQCGSKHYQKRGFFYANSLAYQRYQCSPIKGCGKWFRSANAIKQNKEKVLGC